MKRLGGWPNGTVKREDSREAMWVAASREPVKGERGVPSGLLGLFAFRNRKDSA
jgi:hypothetical protein